MNKKELNLDALADEIIRVFYPTYEQAIPGMKNAIIQKKQRIKQILEYHIKSVCDSETEKLKLIAECFEFPYTVFFKSVDELKEMKSKIYRIRHPFSAPLEDKGKRE